MDTGLATMDERPHACTTLAGDVLHRCHAPPGPPSVAQGLEGAAVSTIRKIRIPTWLVHAGSTRNLHGHITSRRGDICCNPRRCGHCICGLHRNTCGFCGLPGLRLCSNECISLN